MPSELTQADLTRAFTDVGLQPGDSVIVHSAFRTLGAVQDGPQTAIATLLEAIGPRGNLMLPTFNYTLPPGEPFDPAHTPGLTGVLTETGRAWPGAVRSLCPTHSVAVIGPDAKELTADHLRFRAVGIGSPIDRLAKRGGKVLLIGVGHTSNTTIHLGEEYAGVPKAPWAQGLPTWTVRTPDGQIVEHRHDTSTTCSTGFGAAEYPMRQRGLIRDLRHGACKIQLMRAQDVIDSVVRVISEKPDILLCTWPGCVPCTRTRENLRREKKIP
ncbi:MAG: AAC(3) family N-acetyltransferase [Phycisphaerae bacterium]|nr:AAC(3) family N-acetyltransferase [Phycisphaerae bacterium]